LVCARSFGPAFHLGRFFIHEVMLMALQQHPLSAAFPAMPDADIESLADDIRKHGLREPGVLFEDKVLDGWHRYVACERAGVKFRSTELNGEDPVSFVLSHNLHRRHLTASQRAAAIVAATNWRPHGDQKSRSAIVADRTTEEMAKEAEVSTRTIEYAKSAERAGLGKAVRDGKVTADRAAKIAKLPKAKREKALKEPKPPKEKRDPDAKLRAELIDVQGKYADLVEKHADLADTARALEDKLTAFENTDPDEQQQEIMKLQKRIVRLEGEIERLTRSRNDCQNKVNDLIRQVKIERKKHGG